MLSADCSAVVLFLAAKILQSNVKSVLGRVNFMKSTGRRLQLQSSQRRHLSFPDTFRQQQQLSSNYTDACRWIAFGLHMLNFDRNLAILEVLLHCCGEQNYVQGLQLMHVVRQRGLHVNLENWNSCSRWEISRLRFSMTFQSWIGEFI